ncbi:penicillin-binding protein activator [Biformimicrobium ophioploci]|uniref:Penicillin-binding protein activator n=1 Tax=Biformimicrobium ophioploci TaxID=3036711 RepID=A0ABQ6LX44_9GAMM|nr:penicillin-binding protein activator [Microbulbifer sp. NKW57]GMG86631.1 penicillin-binding protein activator [Microbulbifer sp. NKW57]
MPAKRRQFRFALTMPKPVPAIASAALVLALTACGSQAPKQQPPLVPEQRTQPGLDRGAAERLMQQAMSNATAERDRQLLQAGVIFAGLQDEERASQALQQIEAENLAQQEFADYALHYGKILSNQADLMEAHELVSAERVSSGIAFLPVETRVPLRQLRAELFSLFGEIDSAIAEHRALASIARTEEETRANNEGFWTTLMQLPSAELSARAASTSDPEMRAWYELAKLGRDTQMDISSQTTALQRWRERWPGHTANLTAPRQLQAFEQVAANQPQNIALLLPLTGKLSRAGRAIQDGFLAAYYAAMNNGAQVPDIQIYDSAAGNFEETYQQAVNGGAQFIIGPLDKELVNNLAATESLPVPTLALNYAETGRLTGDLVQFGLAIEDEARQVARQAYQLGHRQALVVAPGTGWGTRATEAFREEWQRLGGNIPSVAEYANQAAISKSINDSLLIAEGRAREREIRRAIARPLKFTPRRRADLDVVFAIARNDAARQIKPMLAYYYAGDLPVFATSQIYSGDDRERNRDLNGIRFTAMPWLFEGDNAIKDSIERQAKPSAAFAGLYAMGADAFRLFGRLPLLREFSEQRVFGLTGTLMLSADGKIEREQVWAQVRNGRARAITSAEYRKPMPTASRTDVVQAEEPLPAPEQLQDQIQQ